MRDVVHHLISNLKKGVGELSSSDRHGYCSDLTQLVEKQLHIADKLTRTQELSYFSYLDLLRNLRILQGAVRGIGSLVDGHCRWQQLKIQTTEAEKKLNIAEAEGTRVDQVLLSKSKGSDSANFLLSAIPLGFVLGYFLVGYLYASDAETSLGWWGMFLLWPLAFFVVLLGGILSMVDGMSIKDASGSWWMMIVRPLLLLLIPAILLSA